MRPLASPIAAALLLAAPARSCPTVPLGPSGTPPPAVIVIAGAASGDLAGHSVSSAGDVDGDGRDDLIIGALNAGPNGPSSGAAYVVLGTSGGFPSPLALGALTGADGFVLRGAAAGDFTGISVSAAGDVNGDGLPDVIVGAYAADPNGSSSGASYVVFGTSKGYAPAIELSALDGTAGFALHGSVALERSGRSVASAGDFNGDGFDDIAIGALNSNSGGIGSGRAYVVFGRATWPAAVPLGGLTGGNGFAINGAAPGDQLGVSVGGAGDLDGDGFDDVILGGDGASPGGVHSGAAWVIYGGAGPFAAVISLAALAPPAGAALHGAAAGDLTGIDVGAAGDVNGDGLDDAVVGASGSALSTGRAYVIFGNAARLPSPVLLGDLDGTSGFAVVGAAPGDDAGTSAAAAGDLDGDGIGDLVVGAPGAAYVIFGHRGAFPRSFAVAGLDGTDGVTFSRGGDGTGQSAAAAGDVDGDGAPDLILGAPFAAPFGLPSGAAHLVSGAGRDCNGNGVADLVDLTCSTSLDVNGNGRPDECDPDLDGDGVVGNADLTALLAAWGPCPGPPAPCPGDLDGDGSTGMTDLLDLLAAWGAGLSAP